MKTALYPLKFKAIFKEKIWGGQKIKTFLHKDFSPLSNCGETWEISTVKDNVSIVNNGALAGENLVKLISDYQDELVGKSVYEKFGTELPLLVKFIDANDDLSIQVHPDDSLAQTRHQSFGKTEMWYILQADKDSRISVGFNQEVTKELYLQKLNDNELEDILNFEDVNSGDVYFLPAGRVHYIGKGVLLAEIQQPSDITYRIYDFDRIGLDGKKRELHTEEALGALDFKAYEEYRTSYEATENKESDLVSCEFFTTNILKLSGSTVLNYKDKDSFVIHTCVSGDYTISFNNETYSVSFGECILLPAILGDISVYSPNGCEILVSYCASV